MGKCQVGPQISVMQLDEAFHETGTTGRNPGVEGRAMYV